MGTVGSRLRYYRRCEAGTLPWAAARRPHVGKQQCDPAAANLTAALQQNSSAQPSPKQNVNKMMAEDSLLWLFWCTRPPVCLTVRPSYSTFITISLCSPSPMGLLTTSWCTRHSTPRHNMPPCSLEEMVSAGWDLVQHLEGLQDVSVSPKGLEQGLASMEAVSEQRSRLQVRAGAAQVRLSGGLHLSGCCDAGNCGGGGVGVG